MYTLKKEFRFEAAHKLPAHDGKCRNLHGHSWIGRVIVKGTELHLTGSKAGMLVDFADLSKIVKPVVEEFLDHHYLNETLQMENPTSERIAHWLFERFNMQIGNLAAVEIEETCTSSCCYEGH